MKIETRNSKTRNSQPIPSIVPYAAIFDGRARTFANGTTFANAAIFANATTIVILSEAKDLSVRCTSAPRFSSFAFRVSIFSAPGGTK